MAIQRIKIEELTGCDPKAIPESVFSSATPVILRGLVESWPMVEASKKSPQQSLEYLLNFKTDEPITVFYGEPEIDGRVFYNHDYSGFNFETLRLPLQKIASELVKNLSNKQSPMLYVGSTMVDKWLPGFRAENDIEFEDNDPLVSLWMGNQSRIAAHYDFASNIACCVAGRRRFTLFPPEQIDNLYIGPIDFTPAGQPISLVDFKHPGFEKYPKFRQALDSALTIDLEPGDALLIPSMWWHHVESLDAFNALVNYWWRSSPNYLGTPLNVLQHALMGLRDLPTEQRAIWQNLFEHYIFNAKDENFEHIPESARGVLNKMDEKTAADIRDLLISRLQR
jgi:hypothetical protein